MLTYWLLVRPHIYHGQSDPNERVSQRWHHRLGPPWWNSNAYAIRSKCEKKIESDEKSFQIMYLQFTNPDFAAPRGANCVIRVTVEQLPLRR
jgi:hypothetical protein